MINHSITQSLNNQKSSISNSPSPILLLRDSVLLELLVQIAPRGPDDLRGLRDVPVVLAELADQEGALGRLLELAQGARALLFIIGRGGLLFKADDIAEVVDVNRVPRRHDDEPLDRVLQLAHVPLPPRLLHVLEGGGGEALRAAVVVAAEEVREVLDERGNVFPAIAQRRHADGDDAQAEV